MGAYENPALIQDRSGEIFAQGMAAFGAGIAKGINTYTAKMEARRKEAAQEAKQRKQRENAIDLAGIKAFDDWSAQRRKDIPKNAPAIAFKNVEAFISESAPGYLDAYKRRALAETAEERTTAQKEIDLFNQNAAKQTQATANLTSGITEVGELSGSPNAVFFESKDQVAWQMLDKGLAIDGFKDLDITTSRNENGETILTLNANVDDGEDVAAKLAKYGLKPEDYTDGKFSFEMNLNTYRTDNYIAKGFEVKDFKQAGTNTGFLDEQGQIDTSSIKKVTNAQGRQIDYYDAAGYVETITYEIEAQCESWFSGDPEDNAQMRATLKKMGYNNDEIKTAIEMGVTTADVEGSVADLYRDNILGKIKKTSPGRATKAVIADIEKYNQTVSEDQRMTVPLEGDLYLYSAAELVPTTTTTTDGPDAFEKSVNRGLKIYEGLANQTFETADDLVSYINKNASTKGAKPVTGVAILEEVVNAKDQRTGEPLEVYEDIRLAYEGNEDDGLTPAQRKANAFELLKRQQGIDEGTVMLVSGTGVPVDRMNINNPDQYRRIILQRSGYNDEKVTEIMRRAREEFDQYLED